MEYKRHKEAHIIVVADRYKGRIPPVFSATSSSIHPFLIPAVNVGAKIYDMDMDEDVVDVKKWINLPGIRAYYDFFTLHGREFH